MSSSLGPAHLPQQSCSGLLNLTDGLLGAGLRALVLVTNEPLRRLHPAVVRPGRAWVEAEFGPLEEEEVNAWLERRGVDAVLDRSATLAELFALADGRPMDEATAFGFVR